MYHGPNHLPQVFDTSPAANEDSSYQAFFVICRFRIFLKEVYPCEKLL
jgi:hypothetical protein